MLDNILFCWAERLVGRCRSRSRHMNRQKIIKCFHGIAKKPPERFNWRLVRTLDSIFCWFRVRHFNFWRVLWECPQICCVQVTAIASVVNNYINANNHLVKFQNIQQLEKFSILSLIRGHFFAIITFSALGKFWFLGLFFKKILNGVSTNAKGGFILGSSPSQINSGLQIGIYFLVNGSSKNLWGITFLKIM